MTDFPVPSWFHLTQGSLDSRWHELVGGGTTTQTVGKMVQVTHSSLGTQRPSGVDTDIAMRSSCFTLRM